MTQLGLCAAIDRTLTMEDEAIAGLANTHFIGIVCGVYVEYACQAMKHCERMQTYTDLGVSGKGS